MEKTPWHIILILSLLYTPTATGASWVVSAENGDFAGIREALEAICSGDTLLIAPGDYDETQSELLEEIDLDSVTMIGTGDLPQEVGITGIWLWFTGGGHHRAENLRLYGQVRLLQGYPVSDFTMRNCIVGSHVDSVYGTRVALGGGTILVEDCVFEDIVTNNSAAPFGGTGLDLVLASSGALVRRSVFSNIRSDGSAAALGVVSNCLVEDCVFVGNVGNGGAAIVTSNPCCGYPNGVRIERCTFWDNESIDGYGAVYLQANYAEVRHSIFAGTKNGVGFSGPSGGIVECNAFWQNDRGDFECGFCQEDGNIHLDPMFCDPEGGDLSLHADSPCLPGLRQGYECPRAGALDVGCGAATFPEFDAAVSSFRLRPIAPNPSRGSVRIAMDLVHQSDVAVELFAVDGTKVASWEHGSYSPGRVDLGPLDLGPLGLPSGAYYLRVRAGDDSGVGRVVLLSDP